MAKEEVVARTAEGASVTFEYDFGDTLDEMVKRFGEEICTAHTKRSLIVASQGHARNLMRQEKSPDEIQQLMGAWKPGAPRVAKSKVERIEELMAQMTPVEREQYIKELKASAAKAAKTA